MSATESADNTGRRTSKIIRLGAKSLPELRRVIAEAANDPQRALAASNPAAFSLHDRFRLAVVADSPSQLAHRLQLTQGALARDGSPRTFEEQGVFFGEVPVKRPKIAVLFPGQGSQYTGMLRELCTRHQEARQCRLEVNAASASLGFELFDDLAWREPNLLGIDIWHTQAAMLMADWICWRSLLGLGVEPDLVAGHSFGEFAALSAAGSWDLDEALQATRSRCEAVAACGPSPGIMLSIHAPRSDVERAWRSGLTKSGYVPTMAPIKRSSEVRRRQ